MNTEKKFNLATDRIEFEGTKCVLRIESYQNGGATALCLYDETTNEPVLVATVNMPGVPLSPNQVLIKDYSENSGILAALEKAGVVAHTGKKVRSGFVSVDVCELLPVVELPHRQEQA